MFLRYNVYINIHQNVKQIAMPTQVSTSAVWRHILPTKDRCDGFCGKFHVDNLGTENNSALKSAEMEKRNKIAQTQVLDLKIAQKTRNLRHIIIHAKTA